MEFTGTGTEEEAVADTRQPPETMRAGSGRTVGRRRENRQADVRSSEVGGDEDRR